MKRKWSDLDLQKKTMILASLGLVLWLVTFSVVYYEIQSLNKATLDLEIVEDLYDSILEMRRYEKNFMLYQGQENRDQTIQFFNITRQVYGQLSKSPENFYDIKEGMAELGQEIEAYGHLVEYFIIGNSSSGEVGKNQKKIRAAGSRLIDLAQELLDFSRRKVARTAHNAIRLPMISSGLLILLFLVGLVLINRKVVRPLTMLERATEKIGRGDFGPISHPEKIESEVDRLVFAFNRMVEELDARQEQIVHARKIASLGTLVSGVAHELNNPINNIILTVDTLSGKRKLTDERRAELQKDILEQSIRASNIVKNLLDFSRAEVSAMQDVDINSLLNNIFKIIENDLSMKKIRLQKQIDPHLPLLAGNRQGLQQVFFNLVVNAIQAMTINGELTVTAILDENRWVVISVQDTGEGISKEDIPHIFDPFFTTKEVGKGTGLGLSVSYGIVKKHGGRITVESEKAKGTQFIVSLPAKDDMADE